MGHSLQCYHFHNTLSLLNLNGSPNNRLCMSHAQSSPEEVTSDVTSEKYYNLEKKYGKEPKISADELKRMRWNWH